MQLSSFAEVVAIYRFARQHGLLCGCAVLGFSLKSRGT